MILQSNGTFEIPWEDYLVPIFRIKQIHLIDKDHTFVVYKPVKYGMWSERCDGELYNMPFTVVCCSNCGNVQSEETNYCSNCGAQMRRI